MIQIIYLYIYIFMIYIIYTLHIYIYTYVACIYIYNTFINLEGQNTKIISGGCFCLADPLQRLEDMNHTNSYGLIKGLQFGSFVFQYYCMVPWSLVGRLWAWYALNEFCWIFFPPKNETGIQHVYLVMESWNPEIFCLSDGSLGAPCWRFPDPSPGPITTS